MTATVDVDEARRALEQYLIQSTDVRDDQVLSTLALADFVIQYMPLLLDEIETHRRAAAVLDRHRTCPVCGGRFTTTKSGGMRYHCGDVWRGGYRQTCAGVGQLPKEEATS